MSPQQKKHPLATFILSCTLLVLLSGCAPSFTCAISCPSRPTPQAYPYTPINTTVIPHVTVALYDDTPPLQRAEYFSKMLHMLADRIDSAIVPGEDGLDIFVGAITHKSIGQDLIAFHVKPIPPDKPKPVLQTCPTEADQGETPTHFANRSAACQQANSKAISDWQDFLKTNHELLSQVKAQAKQQIDAMENLKPTWDSIADDIYGALASASSHLSHFSSGEKILLLSSPMRNNTAIDQTENVSLRQTIVRVDFFSCDTSASSCDSIKTYWTEKLMSYGASSVTWYTPQDTLVEAPTF